MTIEVRTPALDEVERYIDVHRTGFNSHWAADLRARNIEFLSAPSGHTLHAAYEGAEMVGTAMSIPLTVTVPGGGAVAACGLTWVATLPSHRRRGVMSALLDAHLALARERNCVVSVLDAVDSGLYGRYGYGTATYDVELTIPTAHVTFKEPPTGCTIRFVEARELGRRDAAGLARGAATAHGDDEPPRPRGRVVGGRARGLPDRRRGRRGRGRRLRLVHGRGPLDIGARRLQGEGRRADRVLDRGLRRAVVGADLARHGDDGVRHVSTGRRAAPAPHHRAAPHRPVAPGRQPVAARARRAGGCWRRGPTGRARRACSTSPASGSGSIRPTARSSRPGRPPT